MFVKILRWSLKFIYKKNEDMNENLKSEDLLKVLEKLKDLSIETQNYELAASLRELRMLIPKLRDFGLNENELFTDIAVRINCVIREWKDQLAPSSKKLEEWLKD